MAAYSLVAATLLLGAAMTVVDLVGSEDHGRSWHKAAARAKGGEVGKRGCC